MMLCPASPEIPLTVTGRTVDTLLECGSGGSSSPCRCVRRRTHDNLARAGWAALQGKYLSAEVKRGQTSRAQRHSPRVDEKRSKRDNLRVLVLPSQIRTESQTAGERPQACLVDWQTMPHRCIGASQLQQKQPTSVFPLISPAISVDASQRCLHELGGSGAGPGRTTRPAVPWTRLRAGTTMRMMPQRVRFPLFFVQG